MYLQLFELIYMWRIYLLEYWISKWGGAKIILWPTEAEPGLCWLSISSLLQAGQTQLVSPLFSIIDHNCPLLSTKTEDRSLGSPSSFPLYLPAFDRSTQVSFISKGFAANSYGKNIEDQSITKVGEKWRL